MKSIPKLLLLSLAFTFSSVSMAQDAKSQYCAKTDLKQQLNDGENRLAFRNHGGLMNGGVCWWHSRFLRNASYLAYFSPEKPIPQDTYITKKRRKSSGRGYTQYEVPAPGSIHAILDSIKSGNEVVEITGFENLNDFSRHFRSEIIELLEKWQIEDGFIKQQWIVGLSGSHIVEPSKLEEIMNETFERVNNDEIVYHKLQIKGIVAHAWLVQDMVKTDKGYKLFVIDSNYNSITTYEYQMGDQSLYHRGYGQFVPYIENTREEGKLQKTKLKFCK